MEKTYNEQQIEGLQSADIYIIKLINGINIYFDYIKKEKDQEASNLLSYIVEGIDWTNEIVRLTKHVQKENMDELVMNEYLEILEVNFNKGSKEQVCEILKEKILPLLEQWKCSISNIISV